MNLSAPKSTTFYVALALGILGFLGFLFQLPVITSIAFWLVLAGFIVLVVSVLIPNL